MKPYLYSKVLQGFFSLYLKAAQTAPMIRLSILTWHWVICTHVRQEKKKIVFYMVGRPAATCVLSFGGNTPHTKPPNTPHLRLWPSNLGRPGALSHYDMCATMMDDDDDPEFADYFFVMVCVVSLQSWQENAWNGYLHPGWKSISKEVQNTGCAHAHKLPTPACLPAKLAGHWLMCVGSTAMLMH